MLLVGRVTFLLASVMVLVTQSVNFAKREQTLQGDQTRPESDQILQADQKHQTDQSDQTDQTPNRI